jgi:hypothetical protein
MVAELRSARHPPRERLRAPLAPWKMRSMVRELGLRRALRKLDRIPAGLALAAGLGLGAGLGLVCLREPSAAGLTGFVLLVAAAVPLAISARPVAVPAGEPEGEGARPPLGRLKAALTRKVHPALILPGLLGIVAAMVLIDFIDSRARLPPEIPLMPARRETATGAVRTGGGVPAEPHFPAPASSATGTATAPVSPTSSSRRDPKASPSQTPRAAPSQTPRAAPTETLRAAPSQTPRAVPSQSPPPKADDPYG